MGEVLARLEQEEAKVNPVQCLSPSRLALVPHEARATTPLAFYDVGFLALAIRAPLDLALVVRLATPPRFLGVVVGFTALFADVPVHRHPPPRPAPTGASSSRWRL